MQLSTKEGVVDHINVIIDLSSRVQHKLTASGSLQEIGPLDREQVSKAIVERRCFVLLDETERVIGCAFAREIEEDYFPSTIEFKITDFAKPWIYLHSIMLDPTVQGRGIGLPFFRDVVKSIESSGGTAFLDCWAGNEKLRGFYERAGCRYIATVPENDYEIAVFVKSLGPG